MMYPDVFAGGYGPGYGPEAFMAWADSLDSYIAQNQVSSWESLSLAVSLLRGEAKAWWRVEKEARCCEEELIHTWDELKVVMSFKYIPGFEWEEEEPNLDFLLEDIEQAVSMMAAKQEGETQELCLHVPDQTKQQEKVLGESSTASELALVLIDQGESFQSLSCGLLTGFTLDFQPSLVEYLRVVKGLQQVAFEPGGSLSVSRRSNNMLAQKTVSYKLDLQGFFTPEKQDLRSNLFEGREDGVILSSCSENRGETGGNTFFIRSLTDQNKLRSTKQKLVVDREIPKLENEYGDHYTRPPDPLQHANQVIMSTSQDVMRDIRGIFLSSHMGLVRPPDRSARFLLDFEDLTILSYQEKHGTHYETAMVEACLWSKWREDFAAAADYELNGKKRLLALSSVCSNILRHVRGLQHFVFKPGEEVCMCKDRNQSVIDRARKLEMIEQGSKSFLKHGKGLQCWVFDPGDDHGFIILQDLDLRTNPFEGREYGVILSRLKLKGLKPMYGSVISLIMVQLNGQFQGLIGMIYEVLDREKDERLDTVLFHLFVSACSWGSREELEQETIEAGSEHGDQSAGSSWYGEHSDQEKKQVGSASTIRWHASLMEDALASQLDQSQDQRPRLKDKLFSALLWRDSAGERDNLQRK